MKNIYFLWVESVILVGPLIIDNIFLVIIKGRLHLQVADFPAKSVLGTDPVLLAVLRLL